MTGAAPRRAKRASAGHDADGDVWRVRVSDSLVALKVEDPVVGWSTLLSLWPVQARALGCALISRAQECEKVQ